MLKANALSSLGSSAPVAPPASRLGRKKLFFLVCTEVLRAGPLRGPRKKLLVETQRGLRLDPASAKRVLSRAIELRADPPEPRQSFSPASLMAQALALSPDGFDRSDRDAMLLIQLGVILGIPEIEVRHKIELCGFQPVTIEIESDVDSMSIASEVVPAVVVDTSPVATPASFVEEPPAPLAPAPERAVTQLDDEVAPMPRWVPALLCGLFFLVLSGLFFGRQRQQAREFERGVAIARPTQKACLRALKLAEGDHHGQALKLLASDLQRVQSHKEEYKLGFLLAMLRYSQGRVLHSQLRATPRAFSAPGALERQHLQIDEAFQEALERIGPYQVASRETFEVILRGIAEYRAEIGQGDQAKSLLAMLAP